MTSSLPLLFNQWLKEGCRLTRFTHLLTKPQDTGAISMNVTNATTFGAANAYAARGSFSPVLCLGSSICLLVPCVVQDKTQTQVFIWSTETQRFYDEELIWGLLFVQPNYMTNSSITIPSRPHCALTSHQQLGVRFLVSSYQMPCRTTPLR